MRTGSCGEVKRGSGLYRVCARVACSVCSLCEGVDERPFSTRDAASIRDREHARTSQPCIATTRWMTRRNPRVRDRHSVARADTRPKRNVDRCHCSATRASRQRRWRAPRCATAGSTHVRSVLSLGIARAACRGPARRCRSTGSRRPVAMALSLEQRGSSAKATTRGGRHASLETAVGESRESVLRLPGNNIVRGLHHRTMRDAGRHLPFEFPGPMLPACTPLPLSGGGAEESTRPVSRLTSAGVNPWPLLSTSSQRRPISSM